MSDGRKYPNKVVIAEMDDLAQIDALLEELAEDIIKVETDLEFSTRDEEWAHRARRALTAFRLCRRDLLDRQRVLRRERRPERSVHTPGPLAAELMAEIDTFALDAYRTADDAVQGQRWLVQRLEALRAERDAVIGEPPTVRDHAFVRRANVAIRKAGTLRNDLLKHISELRRAERDVANAERDATAEKLFVEASRGILDKPTFMAVWAEVYRRRPDLLRAA